MITPTQKSAHLFDADYTIMLEDLQATFDWSLQTLGSHLFTTDASDLMDVYLSALPQENRQHHTCRTCRKFMDTYGGLVAIGPNGQLIPAMWQEGTGYYAPAIHKVIQTVYKSKVTVVFYSDLSVWGTPKTGDWTHFAVHSPFKWNNKLQTPYQAMAEKKQDYLQMVTALQEFSAGTIQQAVQILESDSLFRSEKFIGSAKWLLKLHEDRSLTRDSKGRDNILWKAVASAPIGFCHPRSSVIGTLLEDIKAGLTFETIRRNFSEKVNPLQYQRPQAAPTVSNIMQAEKIIETLGIAKSLDRRYAKVEEIVAMWRPVVSMPHRTRVCSACHSHVFWDNGDVTYRCNCRQEWKWVDDTEKKGVFSHLVKTLETPMLELPEQTMTWVKFEKEVLPSAMSIRYVVPMRRDGYAGILTAVDPDAPPILKWDKPDARNPFSHYLHTNGSYPQDFNLKSGDCKVTAVTSDPSVWTGYKIQRQAVIFTLEGAKDLKHTGCGLALFPETLRSELHSIRATIEAYSKSKVLEGGDEATACGIRLQRGQHWGARFKVTTISGSVLKIKLDRWD